MNYVTLFCFRSHYKVDKKRRYLTRLNTGSRVLFLHRFCGWKDFLYVGMCVCVCLLLLHCRGRNFYMISAKARSSSKIGYMTPTMIFLKSKYYRYYKLHNIHLCSYFFFATPGKKFLDPNRSYISTSQTKIRNVCLLVTLEYCRSSVAQLQPTPAYVEA